MSIFLEKLQCLKTLNPLAAEMSLRELRPLADAATDQEWPAVEAFSNELLAAYLESAVKRAERETVKEYYYLLEDSGSKYQSPPDPKTEDIDETNLALVPSGRYDAYNWTALKSDAEVPRHLENAFHAARKRNTMVETVFEVLFELQVRCHREKALAWQLTVATGSKDRPCDPDVARDLLRVWQPEETLPRPFFQRILKWSADPAVIRNWPTVASEADRLLRNHALKRWLVDQDERHALVAHIRKAPVLSYSPRLVSWYQELLDELGETTACFVAQAEAWRNDSLDWRQSVLERELERLNLLATPILILSDLYFTEPDGGWNFAMAMFGFSTKQKRLWDECLEESSFNAVTRFFLFDLRAGRTPQETISTLCFGDTHLEEQLINELDLLSKKFDSFEQRDIVARALAPIYAGYREKSLRTAEIGRRYRSVMRLLHTDSLQNLLPNADETISRVARAISTLSVTASTCRKYLSSRQSDDPNLQTLIAEDQAFIESIRSLRASRLAEILLKE